MHAASESSLPRRLFDSLDINGDGSINRAELENALRHSAAHMSRSMIVAALERMEHTNQLMYREGKIILI